MIQLFPIPPPLTIRVCTCGTRSRRERTGPTESVMERKDLVVGRADRSYIGSTGSVSILSFFFTFFVFTVGLPSNACHAICLTGHSFLCVCVCHLSEDSLLGSVLRSLFDVDHRSPYTLANHFCLFFLCLLFIVCLYRMRHWARPRVNRLYGHQRFSKGSLICEKMSERNPFRPTSSGSSGALVTDARLSQLVDPIARLVDAYPPHDRRNGGYHNQRDSSEYTHLTAYPAIIEPVTYDDGTTR